MTTDYKVKFVESLEPVMQNISAVGADGRDSGARHDTDGAHGQPNGVPQTSSGSALRTSNTSKSLPSTPKHRSSARVEFQTDFPEHCQMFDGHMKV